MCTRLEKIQKDFLWGDGALEKKTHLVNWSAVCVDMRQGDLGIRNHVALEGFFVETSHYRQIWDRRRRLVFKRSEGSLWCGSMKSY